jgi:uncharacterized protein
MGMNKFMRGFLLFAGSICIGLGILGIVLPLFPTTPFLLLAAACYVRSSEKMYQRLIANRWFGRHIRNYREKKGILFSTKVLAICFLWISILYSIIFVVHVLWLRMLLAAIAAGVTWHIVSIRTLKDEADKKRDV